MQTTAQAKQSVDTITSGTGSFKAVCHKCQYVGFEPNRSRCAHCGFPLILEAYESAQVALREIFDRSSVEIGVHVKAPPLPGVDPQKRKAQLLAEARRRLRTESQLARAGTAGSAAPVARPITVSPVAGAVTPAYHAVAASAPVAPAPAYHAVAAPPATAGRPGAPPAGMATGMTGYDAVPSLAAPGRMRLGLMALAFISAVAVGVLAAAMNSGL